MRLREQVSAVLAEKGPLTLPEICLELQRRAGIAPMNEGDFLTQKLYRAVSAQSIDELNKQRAKNIQARFELLQSKGYTMTILFNLLRTSGAFVGVVRERKLNKKSADRVLVMEWENVK